MILLTFLILQKEFLELSRLEVDIRVEEWFCRGQRVSFVGGKKVSLGGGVPVTRVTRVGADGPVHSPQTVWGVHRSITFLVPLARSRDQSPTSARAQRCHKVTNL